MRSHPAEGLSDDFYSTTIKIDPTKTHINPGFETEDPITKTAQDAQKLAPPVKEKVEELLGRRADRLAKRAQDTTSKVDYERAHTAIRQLLKVRRQEREQ